MLTITDSKVPWPLRTFAVTDAESMVLLLVKGKVSFPGILGHP
jgi:hypothetical protein